MPLLRLRYPCEHPEHKNLWLHGLLTAVARCSWHEAHLVILVSSSCWSSCFCDAAKLNVLSTISGVPTNWPNLFNDLRTSDCLTLGCTAFRAFVYVNDELLHVLDSTVGDSGRTGWPAHVPIEAPMVCC